MITARRRPGRRIVRLGASHALDPFTAAMRIAAFIVAIVVSNLVVIGGVAVVALAGPGASTPLIWLPVVALTLIVYPPLLAGSLLSYWDARSSEETTRFFRRWFIGLGVAQLVGAVAVLLFSVLAGAAWWLAPAYVVIAALLDVLAVCVGAALRRREEARRPGPVPWAPLTRQQIVRRILLIVGVFVVVLLVAGIGASVLVASVGTGRERNGATALLFALQIAFLAAGITCTATTFRLQRQVREQVTRDVGVLRRIAKVVVRGKRVELQPDEELLATRYAAIVSVSLPFTLGFILLLYAGIAAQQVQQLIAGRLEGISGGLLVFLVVALVVLTPLQIVRIRRVRRYAREHAALLEDAGTSSLS